MFYKCNLWNVPTQIKDSIVYSHLTSGSSFMGRLSCRPSAWHSQAYITCVITLCRRLQPDTRRTSVCGPQVGNRDRQVVSGLGVAVSTPTFLQSRQPVSWQQCHRRQQLLSKPGHGWRTLVLHNGSCIPLAMVHRPLLWLVSALY